VTAVRRTPATLTQSTSRRESGRERRRRRESGQDVDQSPGERGATKRQLTLPPFCLEPCRTLDD
jgi:hypothetical protein